ncbi:MAG: hypothetical protein WCP35_08250 [Verrucomicrobiota bacterium]
MFQGTVTPPNTKAATVSLAPAVLRLILAQAAMVTVEVSVR